MANKTSIFIDNSAPAVNAAWLNINQTEANNIIATSGQSVDNTGLVNNQEAIGIASYAAQGSVFCTDSGAADAYVVTQVSPFLAPFALKNGLTIRFRAGNANTGAATVNPFGFGAGSIKQSDGSSALTAGMISTSFDTLIRYDGTNWRLVSVLSLNPTIQKFTSGSGTYTTPSGVVYIRVRMLGGGGGGGGGGTQATATTGSNGGNTTFGTTLLVANGGGAGTSGVAAGGTVSLGSAIGTALRGNDGGSYMAMTTQFCTGGAGGAGALGGGSAGFSNGGASSGATNSGSGGGGGGTNAAAGLHYGMGGGAAGGFVDAIIASPSATYSYAIGAGGAAGAAGTDGYIGGAGGSGYIEVTEYYNN